MSAFRTVLLPVGKRAIGVICEGNAITNCGIALTRPGRCPNCGRYLTETEYTAAKAAREAA